MGSLDLNRDEKMTLITSQRQNMNQISHPKLNFADFSPTIASSPLLKKTITNNISTSRFDRKVFKSIDFTKVPSTFKNIHIEASTHNKPEKLPEISDNEPVRRRGNSLM